MHSGVNMNTNELGKSFDIHDELEILEAEHGFTLVEINNRHAHACICTYSGQVLSYRPKTEQEDMLFVSDRAYYEEGKAIKGGIPVCWPWFGADPEELGRAAHGFVRNRQWQLTATESLDDGSTRVSLEISDSDETRTLWPHAFRLSIIVTVGASLEVELVTHNTGDSTLTITQALHTYFRVGDIAATRVTGLDGASYLDKLEHFVEKRQSGAVEFNSEVDRVYNDVGDSLGIEDATLGRTIRIGSRGSRTAVVWNPWADIARSMADLDDEDYRRFVCVETANAGNERIEIPAGAEYRLAARYAIER
jgi:glucose-6-phosphate 1-epimerase